MKPYYDDGTCVIYNADARDLPVEDVVQAVVTSPPYNVGIDYAEHNGSCASRSLPAEVLAL